MTADVAYQLKTLRIAVTSMREQQIFHFKAKSRDALARAKECEARVGRMLSDLQCLEGPSMPPKRRADARFERPKCCARRRAARLL
jgi:hypothetical protein